MKRITWAMVLFCWMAALAAAEQGALGQGMVNPGHHEPPAWFHNSFLDLREDVAEAAKNQRRLVLYFYQDGCPYCGKLLQDNFGNKTIADKTQKDFQVVAINLWGDREVTGLQGESLNEKSLAAALQVQFTPTLLFLNEEGEVVLRMNGYYPPHRFEAALDYVANRMDSKQSFNDYFTALNPPPASGELHREAGYRQPPHDLTPGSKPLLLLLEQRQCPACDELHQEALRRSELAEALAGFDVALLDIHSDEPLKTPDGRQLPTSQWVRELGIQYVPALLFIDRNGREVFRSEAYLKAFHLRNVMDYVREGAYLTQPNFQRYLQSKAEALRASGVKVDLMQ